jgi:hypothetical protein
MKGLLYKITSPSSPMVYYGSTTQTLAQRMSTHRSHLKRLQDGHHGSNCSSFQILALGDAQIELVREVEVATRNDLYILEGELQTANPCVNVQVASKFNICPGSQLSITDRAKYMRAWRLKNAKKNSEQCRKDARKCMKRRYAYEKCCKLFREIEI